jgi:hypothetical protein
MGREGRGVKSVALISTLHEPAPVQGRSADSTTRRFFDRPVLAWTLERLAHAKRLNGSVVVCWDDRAEPLRALGATVSPVGRRRPLPMVDGIAAARRWADGWRGGLLNSTEYDLGYHPPAALQAVEACGAEAVVLVNPAAVGVDPGLVDRLIALAADRPAVEFAFLPVAPGFGAMLLRRALVERMSRVSALPGRLLAYQPDAPTRDPLGDDGCVDVPLALARTPGSFKADSDHPARHLAACWQVVRDAFSVTPAERLLALAAAGPGVLPRDVTVELTARRATRPIFSASRLAIARPDLSPALAARLFEQLADRDDVRVTLGGTGDPLAHPQWPVILAAAHDAGVRSIHVETDLLSAESVRLCDAGVDVVSVHLPAMTPATYAAVMGLDALPQVIEHVKSLVTARAERGSGLPLVAPTFVKCRANLGEMETWYDQWLRAIGSAVVAAPSTRAGAVEDVSVGDMAPPQRVPCRRLASRMTALSDGTIVSCEEDVLGRQAMGHLAGERLDTVWAERFGALRSAHADERWDACDLCRACREWHRP